jgi:hypothetical protein
MFLRKPALRRCLIRTAGALLAVVCAGDSRAFARIPPEGAAGVAGGAAVEGDAVLYRLFLKDGGVLVSYGEFARVADRVVLSIPIGGTETNPVLHLLSIAERDVEWERTNAYAHAARARHYAQTTGEADFARLTKEVADTLYQVGLSNDAVRRVALAEAARGRLIEWPQQHYGYRAEELAQMTTWLDQVVSELRVAAGQSSFDLALVATTAAPAAPPVDLLPPPTFRERLELALNAVTRTADAAERVALLRAVLDVLAPSAGPAFAGSWMSAARERATAELAFELRTDQAYAALRMRALSRAAVFEQRADVRGFEGLIRWVLDEDTRLERARPADVAALLATLDVRLDGARRLRLAQDAWVLRTAVIAEYWRSVRNGLDRFLGIRDWLRDVRQLAGPSPGMLPRLVQHASYAQRELARVQPPAEVATSHSTLVAAAGMAVRAASTRLDAVRSGSMDTAWQASSAAAGSLLLLDQAVSELRKLTRAPRPTR